MSENKKIYYQQWVDYHAMLGDDYSYLALDLGLIRMLPMPDKTNTLRVMVPLMTTGQDGLPDDDEKDVLNQIGQALYMSINNAVEIVYVGFIASNNQCGFYFCIGAESIQEQTIIDTMQQFEEYNFEISIIEQDNCGILTECLYPAYHDYEMILNSTVVTQLEKTGDPLTKPRPVHHGFHFRNESDRANFIDKVTQDGFHVDNCYEDDEHDECPFGVEISRMDMVDRQHLFEYTSNLWNLAYEYYGYYDGWDALEVKE